MAKLTSFIHPQGEKAFNAKPEKDTITPARQKVADGIDKVLAAIKAGEEKMRGGIYEIRGDVAKATIRLGSRPLVIEGQEAFHVAKDKLVAFYEEAKKQIVGGEHDEALKALNSNAAPKAAPSGTKKTGNYGWTPERLAKFQATKARKKAEREAAAAGK